ncbi:M15 family metallopeptidase [Jatrophihabitans endophyticus]|uniref:M15 family metallopeptidase n=1 Tax=Jatrophihabitans endophyticus TaxID=1206085 RepID=UPI001A0A5ACC|nr:M15 family metallopeptidase [Jatrophihabitans endophyticus]MBE7190476.1 M15 family metallopeptidase [Jatrophihabitans endophyticus]
MGFRSYQGNTRSENGWRICDRAQCVVTTVAGMNLVVRDGVAADVLTAWLAWYHENVDRIDEYKPIDDWGWSYDNDVANSNHLSGTAFDINATEYPWGGSVMAQRYPQRVAAIRRGLGLFEGNIFWGGDWSRRDEMHFQLNGGTADGDGPSRRLIDFAARRIRNGRLVTGSDLDVGAVTRFVPAFLGPVGSDEKDIREQLHGASARDREAGAPGWAQLGGLDVDAALAAIARAAGVTL